MIDYLIEISTVIVALFIVFCFLLTFRIVAPTLLQKSYRVIMNHILLSTILVLCLFGYAIMADTTETKVGVIGLGAVLVLWMVMSDPSTMTETFTSSDENTTKTKTLEILNELVKQIENTEASISSLPKANVRLQNKIVKVKQSVSQIMKQYQTNETFAVNRAAVKKKAKNMVQQKLDKIITLIDKEIENVKTDKDFCENETMNAFLQYILEVNPAAFFEENDQGSSEVEEDSSESSNSSGGGLDQADLQSSMTLDLYKTRSLAIFNLIRRRKELTCNTLRLELSGKNTYKGMIPPTDLKLKTREFNMTPLQAQEILQNPDDIERILRKEAEFDDKGNMKEDKQKKPTIVKIMQLMTYLKDSKISKESSPQTDTTVYVLV